MPVETYELKVAAKLAQQDVLNVMHYRVDNDSEGATVAFANDLCNGWDSIVKPLWLACLPPDYELRYIYARRVIAPGGDGWWLEYPGGTTNGELGTHTGPAALSPIIKLYGGLATPYQGRIFMPGIAESMVINNVYQTAFTDAIADLIAGFVTWTHTDYEWNLAIRRRSNNTSQAVTSAALGPIKGFIGARRSAG